MTAPHKTAFDTDRRQLATLLDLSPDAGRLWRDEELGALLRHQMTAPMQVDLINLERGLALKVRTLAEAQGLTLKSFGDLLAHPNPPVELLKITKDFAKACRLSPRSPVPHEIAARRAGDPAILLADASKAAAELGWKPERSDLAEIIRTAWAWHRSRAPRATP